MDMNMKKSAGTKKTTATPKKDGNSSNILVMLDLFTSTNVDPAVKSGRVTKRAPKTPSKLKRVDSDDDEDEAMGNAGITAGAADEEV